MYRGPRFILEFKINIEPYQKDILDKEYYKCNRLYNNAARYAIKQINQLKRTKKYKSIIKDKKGNTKEIYKFKRKKRYGKSLNNHSPGYLDSRLLKRLMNMD